MLKTKLKLMLKKDVGRLCRRTRVSEARLSGGAICRLSLLLFPVAWEPHSAARWTQLFDRVTDEWFEVEDLASECLVTWRWRQ